MTITDFGTLANGQTVHRVALQNEHLSVGVLSFGAILQDLRLRGIGHGLTLGSDHLAEYEGALCYHGALVAPVVNRFTNASAPLNGQTLRFDPNQDGRHTLHSGKAGTHLQVWTLSDASDTTATLSLSLPDGAGGFPGTRHVTATFLLHGPALRLRVTATTDQPTLFNAANHSYWNLDGTAEWSGHRLQIDADHYLPTTADVTPTGDIAATSGTEFDFRTPRAITPQNPALDTNFCLARSQRALTDVLTLTGTTGVAMTVATTEPGIQIYDGRAAVRPGHTAYEGLAIEAQGWPDAPNHAGFPGITLNPGETYQQITEWRFAAP